MSTKPEKKTMDAEDFMEYMEALHDNMKIHVIRDVVRSNVAGHEAMPVVY